MDFKKSLNLGNKGEDIVLKHLKTIYPSSYRLDGAFPEGDICIPERQTLVEIKYDQKAHITKNFVVEMTCNGKASGLSTTKSNVWAFVDNESIYYIERDKIYDCIVRYRISLREFKGNYTDDDSIKMRGYIIPINVIGMYASSIYKYCNKGL